MQGLHNSTLSLLMVLAPVMTLYMIRCICSSALERWGSASSHKFLTKTTHRLGHPMLVTKERRMVFSHRTQGMSHSSIAGVSQAKVFERTVTESCG